MKTIAFINSKGGCAKTTTALNVGLKLYHLKKKVLFVDLDTQGNLSFCLHGKLDKPSVHDMMMKEVTVNEAIQVTSGAINLMCSTWDTIPDRDIVGERKAYRLKDGLKQVSDKYDYCIIDTPPQKGILMSNALTASDGIIIPARADAFSLQGIQQLYQIIDETKEIANPDLKVYGIVITMYESRTVLSNDVYNTLKTMSVRLNTDLFQTRIRKCNAIMEAQMERKHIYMGAFRKSNGAMDYSDLTSEILMKMGE